jgi:L-ribulose-5-phosphate 4-epimerase
MLKFPDERKVLADLHQQLWDAGLVIWTGGNISQRVEGGFLIKPSGVMYPDLTADAMVLSDLDGNVIEGTRSPSSDTAAHAYVYRNMPEVGGVVHTHSNYACGFAAAEKAIPCVLTAIADEFGGDIPLGPFAIIGDDSIGRGIVETLEGHRSPAVLMRQHGVFTIGKSGKDALKAAVMCEDAAKSVSIAMRVGEPKRLANEVIDALFNRYQNVYGQL